LVALLIGVVMTTVWPACEESVMIVSFKLAVLLVVLEIVVLDPVAFAAVVIFVSPEVVVVTTAS